MNCLLWAGAGIMALSLLPADAAGVGVNVLTYHNDNSRTGQNLNETILSPSNVNTNTFGKLWGYAVDGYVYAQPLYVSNLKIPGRGTRNVIFIATQHNSVYAFDADNPSAPRGGMIWHTNLGPSAATPNNDFGNSVRFGTYTDIVPEVGITSTPVIDLPSRTLYVDAFTHDGPGIYHHRLHALSLIDGTEQGFSPVLVAASVAGNGLDSSNGIVTFNPKQQLQRVAMTLSKGVLYVGYGAYSIADPYHGWLIGYEASTLEQLSNAVFNTTPNSSNGIPANPYPGEGGIWMDGNGPAVDAAGNLFLAVGNGAFDGTNGVAGTEFGNCILRLSTENGLSVSDFFTPFNTTYLSANDVDVGSGGVLLLPDEAGSAQHPHLLVACGKPGNIYVADRDNLGGFNPFNDGQLVQEVLNANSGCWSSPAYFNHFIYYQGASAGNQPDVLKEFVFSGGLLQPTPVSQASAAYHYPGATPSISANGTNDAIVWAVQNDGARSGVPAVLHAYNAYNVAQELYNSNQGGSRDQAAGAVKFTVPTIANGKVYVGGQGWVTVYGLLPSSGTFEGLFSDPSGVAPESSGLFSATVTSKGAFSCRILRGGGRVSFSGLFSSGSWSNAALRARPPTLGAQLRLNTRAGEITGVINNGTNWTAPLVAFQETYSRANPAPQSGAYTMTIFGTNDSSQEPGGQGFGRITVNRSGAVTFSGILGDGKAVTTGAAICGQELWPFCATPYAGAGLAIGWLNVGGSTNDIAGSIVWIKPPRSRSSLYPAGFSTQRSVVGSRYALSKGSPILSFNTGVVSFTGANLSPGLSYPVDFAGGKAVSSNEVELIIRAPTGLFVGSTRKSSGQQIRFRGVILQSQQSGGGFFVGGSQTGQVTLQAAPAAD